MPCNCQEGEENITGCTCQARHSYTADDITWDMTFAPCVFLDKDEGGFVVDFDKFHDLVSAGSRAGGSGCAANTWQRSCASIVDSL